MFSFSFLFIPFGSDRESNTRLTLIQGTHPVLSNNALNDVGTLQKIFQDCEML